MITLALGERDARFSADGQPLSDALPLGAAMLCERWLRHAPPLPQELEAAIEAVEDVVMPLHGRWPPAETLRLESDDAALERILTPGAEITRDALEGLFDRAAAIVLGRPASSDPLFADPRVVAQVLVLREVMHHLGFTRLRPARA